MTTDCPRCNGKGYKIIKIPDYKIGSLETRLKKVQCRYCKGTGSVPFFYAESLARGIEP